VLIEVLDAIIDGKGKGEQLEVDEKSAQHLIGIGYAKAVEVKEAPKPKLKTAPKPKTNTK
jgi:hypothetical protein